MGGVTSNCSRVYNSNDKPTGSTSDGTTSATPPERGSENGNGNATSGNNVAGHAAAAATAINGGSGSDIEISTGKNRTTTNATQTYDDGKRRHSMPGCGGVRTELSRMSTANQDGKDSSSGCGCEAVDTDTRIMRRIASTSAHRHQQRSSPLNTSVVGVFGKAPSRHNPLVAAAGRTSSTGSSCSSGGGQGSKRGSFDNGADSPRDCTGAIVPCVTTIGCNGVRIEAAAESLNNDVINRWRRSETTASGNSNDGRFDSPAAGKCGVRFETLTSGGSCSPSNSGTAIGNNMAAVGSRSQQRRRSSIAFLPTYGGGVPTAPATSITATGSGGLFPPRPSCLTAGSSGGGPPISPMDRVNIGFGNATDLVANLISAASGGVGTAGARSPGPTKVEDQFWVPPTVWRKKRAQSLVPQKMSGEGSIPESLPGKNSSASSSLQEMTIAESPPTSFDMSSNVSLAPAAGLQGPDVGQLRRRRASMQDALDFTKINASLYERPTLASQHMFGRIQEENCGSLNLSLQYNADLSLLTVRLVRAQDLVPREGQAGLDPYCRLRLLPDRRHQLHSKVHKRTACPEFDEDFVFDVGPADLADRTLEVLIYDATPAVGGTTLSNGSTVTDECLGQVLVPFDEINLNSTSETVWLWKGITQYSKKNEMEPPGELMFSMTYLASAERLTVVITKARNLKPPEETKTANPFVRVELICSGKRIKKKRTSTKRNTLNPAWNEALVFNLHGKEFGGGGSASMSGGVTSTSFAASGSGLTGNAVQQGSSGATSLPGVQLEMTVFNDNLLGTNEPLGRMVVGDQANCGPAAAAQWMELMAVRNAPARWHVLQHQQSAGDG